MRAIWLIGEDPAFFFDDDDDDDGSSGETYLALTWSYWSYWWVNVVNCRPNQWSHRCDWSSPGHCRWTDTVEMVDRRHWFSVRIEPVSSISVQLNRSCNSSRSRDVDGSIWSSNNSLDSTCQRWCEHQWLLSFHEALSALSNGLQ